MKYRLIASVLLLAILGLLYFDEMPVQPSSPAQERSTNSDDRLYKDVKIP